MSMFPDIAPREYKNGKAVRVADFSEPHYEVVFHYNDTHPEWSPEDAIKHYTALNGNEPLAIDSKNKRLLVAKPIKKVLT